MISTGIVVGGRQCSAVVSSAAGCADSTLPESYNFAHLPLDHSLSLLVHRASDAISYDRLWRERRRSFRFYLHMVEVLSSTLRCDEPESFNTAA